MSQSDFTYECSQTVNSLETYEWDNVWWEHADDDSKPRALMIGDSISCGYRRQVNSILAGRAYVDGFGTSKAVDNPYLIPAVEMFIQQMQRCDIILFNNGLHGWHLSDQEYAEAYRTAVIELKEKYPAVSFGLILTTPVRIPGQSQFDDRNEGVLRRNAAIQKIAGEFNLPFLNFYSAVSDYPELWSNDGVHLTEQGYAVLAQKCADFLDTKLS